MLPIRIGQFVFDTRLSSERGTDEDRSLLERRTWFVVLERGGPGRTRRTLRIAEVFFSIQGEGEFAGTPSVFVRTTGCNLRCWFCDTPYTSMRPEGVIRDWQAVVGQVLELDCQHVVITGGEPLLQPEVIPLVHALRQADRLVTIETAGTIFRPVEADLMSISPKLSNSSPHDSARWQQRHARDRHRPDVIRRLLTLSRYQFKFVVDQPSDLDEIIDYLASFPEVTAEQVWLMPQGIQQTDLAEKGNWLAPAARQLGYRFCPRLQIELFGSVRGT